MRFINSFIIFIILFKYLFLKIQKDTENNLCQYGHIQHIVCMYIIKYNTMKQIKTVFVFCFARSMSRRRRPVISSRRPKRRIKKYFRIKINLLL